MKSHISEIAIAVFLVAILAASLLLPSGIMQLPKWGGALSVLVFCVFTAYIVLIDNERRPTKSHSFRIVVGILAGVTIAAINQFDTDGYFAAALAGGLLGWFGILWAKHL
ncbi:MAG: hypothetical protein ACK5UX_05570 [Burkholderiales bacterium]